MGGKARAYVNKTQKTEVSVASYIEAIEPERMRSDSQALLALMQDVTGAEPAMWGTSIVGFGSYHYQTKSGCEADWPRLGFSSRKTALTLYITPGFSELEGLLAKLGPHKSSVSCLYLKKLEDVDLDVLRAILVKAFAIMAKRYP